MNTFNIVYTKRKDVAKFVLSFGESMALVYGCSLIASDAEIDAEVIAATNVLKEAAGRTLKIYIRKHGTFTNLCKPCDEDLKYWTNAKEVIGVLNIECSEGKKQQFTLSWEEINID